MFIDPPLSGDATEILSSAKPESISSGITAPKFYRGTSWRLPFGSSSLMSVALPVHLSTK